MGGEVCSSEPLVEESHNTAKNENIVLVKTVLPIVYNHPSDYDRNYPALIEPPDRRQRKL